MTRRSVMAKLPPKVRMGLHRYLLASDFGDLAGAAAWLTAQGAPIRKSALGAYARQHRAAIEAEALALRQVRLPGGIRQLRASRIACLQAAAQVPGTADQVVKRAADYLAWVLDGTPPPTGGRR